MMSNSNGASASKCVPYNYQRYTIVCTDDIHALIRRVAHLFLSSEQCSLIMFWDMRAVAEIAAVSITLVNYCT